jgi:hypothetical protein
MIILGLAVLISAGLLIGKKHPWMVLGGVACLFLSVTAIS